MERALNNELFPGLNDLLAQILPEKNESLTTAYKTNTFLAFGVTSGQKKIRDMLLNKHKKVFHQKEYRANRFFNHIE